MHELLSLPDSENSDAGSNSVLEDIVGDADRLPALPQIVQEVGDLVNDPDADVHMVAEVLKRDQSLTASVLKIANSAYYGVPGGVHDVQRAISFLGFNTIYQVVLTASVLRTVSVDAGEEVFDPSELWKYSLGCASMSEIIAQRLQVQNPHLFFTGGLLHDVGKPALYKARPHDFLRAIEEARRQGRSLEESEMNLGLPTHEMVGSTLAKHWRFPSELRVAIEHRRFVLSDRDTPLDPRLRLVADVTHLSDMLVRQMGIGNPGDERAQSIDAKVLRRLGLSSHLLKDMTAELTTKIESSKILLDLLR